MAGSVLTQRLSTGSHTYVCVWTRWDYRLREYRCATHICQFDFILIYVWFEQYMPKYSSDKVNAIQSKRKVSGNAAYVSVSLSKMQVEDLS